MRRPLEIAVPMVVFGLGAVVFVAVGALRDIGSVQLPVLLAVPAVLAAVGLGVRWGAADRVAVVVAALIALAHMLIALGDGHWGLRVLSGALAAAHAYAAVLVLTKPAREYLRGVPDERA